MRITKDWEIKLIEESRKIVKHGWGCCEFSVVQEEECTRILIKSGKWTLFKERKLLTEDDK